MHLLTRDFVCERLKVSHWASYRIVAANSIHMIPSDRVIEILNRTRRAREPQLDFIPSDIVTPDEAESATGVSAKRLLAWTRRSVKVPPHFRINKQTTRFRLSSLKGWLERRVDG